MNIKIWGLAFAGLSGAVFGSAAVAQTAAAQQVIEETVVTAQKRSQSVQDIPASIAVLSGERIDAMRFREPADITTQVANLHNSSALGDGVPIFALRGVSMNEWTLNQGSPVAVYVDEVYKGNPSLLAVPFFDIERIEVLRGPQGTLYGKNATGGAVNMITRRPAAENGGYVTVGAGNYNLIEAEGALNIAPSDTFAVRVAGTWADAGGWMENVNAGVDDGSSIDEYGIRLGVLWQPQDGLELLLRASRGESTPVQYGGKWSDQLPSGTFFGVYGLYNMLGATTLTDPSQEGLDHFEFASERDDKRKLETDAYSLTLNWDMTDEYQLTSITSWDEGEVFNPEDPDGTINRAFFNPTQIESEQFTQDLRVTSSLSGPLNFIGGIHYAYEKIDGANSTSLAAGDLDLNIDGVIDANDCLDPLAFAFGFPPSPAGEAADEALSNLGLSLGGFATFGCRQQNSYEQERTSIAAYLDGSYALTDSLTLRVGVRYSDDKAEMSDFTANMASFDQEPLMTTIPAGENQKFTDTEVTGRLGLDFALSDDILVYAMFSQGYRPGAFNAQAYMDPSEVNWAEPEYLDALEVGFKAEFWSGRARLNASAFHYNYEDQQVLNLDPTFFLQTLTNIDESEITGLEVEASFQITPEFLLSAGVGLLDTEIKKGEISGGGLSGESLPNAPDYDLSIAADWQVLTTDVGSLMLDVDANRKDRATYLIGNAGGSDAYTLLNARLTFTSANEAWNLSLWGKNLTEEEYFVFGGDFIDVIGWSGGVVGAPRTYGAEFSYRF